MIIHFLSLGDRTLVLEAPARGAAIVHLFGAADRPKTPPTAENSTRCVAQALALRGVPT